MTNPPEQVGEGVYRVADGAVNWYLLSEGGQVTIVDTGFPRNWPGIASALEAIGREPGDVAAILLTHTHPDHMGAAERARQETGAPVMAGRDEIERLKGSAKGSSPLKFVPGLSLQVWRPTTIRFVGEATLKGFLSPSWLTEVEALAPGAAVDAPGRPVVIDTHGHSPGHISFHLPGAGALISGDAIATRDPVTGAHGPRLIHDVVNEDPQATRDSLGALAAVDADLLLPGHGEPWRGPISEAVTKARSRL